jgi:hypothetical protein
MDMPLGGADKLNLFVDLMSELLRLNNFNNLAAVLCGIQESSCFKSNKMKQTLDTTRRSTFDLVERIFDEKSNSKLYRRTLHKVVSGGGICVPYMGVWLGDLASVVDGNPPILNGDSINFEKCCLVADVVEELHGYQRMYHDLNVIPCLQKWLVNLNEEVKFTWRFRKTEIGHNFSGVSSSILLKFRIRIQNSQQLMSSQHDEDVKVRNKAHICM